MIHTLLLALSLYRAIQGPSEAERVQSFIRAAHQGQFDLPGSIAVNLPDKPRTVDSSDINLGYRRYDWGDFTVYVDALSGVVLAYGDDSNRADYAKLPRRLTDAQAVALLQRFHRATESPYGLKVFSIRSGRIGDVTIDFAATVDHVPYDRGWGSHATIDGQEGRLRDYLIRGLATPFPRPPAVLTPRVAEADARLSALRLAAEETGVPLVESTGWPFALCIGSPAVQSGGGFLSFLSPPEAQRVKSGEGRLVYSGQIVSSQGADEPAVRLSIMVDALDGRVLSVRDATYGRGGAPAKAAPPAPLAVPTAARPWRVGLGKKPWTAPATAALASDSAPAPTAGTKLSLTDGRAAFPALYDAATGLVAISGKTYKPGPALAALLKRRAKA